MKRIIELIAFVFAAIGLWPAGAWAQELKVGDAAPDFEVPAVTGKEKSKLKLSDFRGKKNVVIAFYPLDWTPV